MSRYDPGTPKMNFGASGAFGTEAQQPRKQPFGLDDFLRLAGGVAPLAGTAIGAIAGGPAGAAIGAGLGGVAGAGANWGADQMDESRTQDEQARLAREQERQARAQASLRILGGL